MSSVYGLRCTVCETTYEDITDWLGHLLTEGHQIKARKTTLEWGKDDRKCVIIAFSTFSMATSSNAEKLLSYFSVKDVDGNRLVHNFVWWPGNLENMALLQFESREIVNKILKRMGNRSIQFPDHRVEFKKASDCLDLEWGLLVRKGARDIRNETITIDLEETEGHDWHENVGEVDGVQEPFDADTEREKENVCVPVQRNIISVKPARDVGALSIKSSQSTTLVTRFQSLMNSVEIPDEEYGQYLEILNDVRKRVGSEYVVNMYRNFNMKLRNPGNNGVLLLHIHHQKQYSRDSTYNNGWEPDPSIREKLLQMSEEPDSLAGFKQDKIKPCENFEGTQYSNPISGLSFALSTNRSKIVDVQMSRMMEYLCSFDSRVKSILSVVYFWSRENNISLAETEIKGNFFHSKIPEPEALNWLVMLFLNQKGILPTVWEIQERPHQVLRHSGHDIGFDPDPAFVEEWKSLHPQPPHPEVGSREYVLDVLRLTKGFFHFLQKTLSGGKSDLHPRIGKNCSREEFITNACLKRPKEMKKFLLQTKLHRNTWPLGIFLRSRSIDSDSLKNALVATKSTTTRARKRKAPGQTGSKRRLKIRKKAVAS